MNKIKEYYYEVETSKIDNTRIVLLADIHYYEKAEKYKLDLVYDRVNKLKPNYIVIVGDLIDEASALDLDIFCNWLIKLSKICNVLISIGNHELIDKNKKATFNKELFDRLRNIDNIVVLDNENITLDNINFRGLTMPFWYYYDKHEPKKQLIDYINSKFNKAKEKEFNILLCHSPLKISKKDVLDKINIKNNLDLVLCGHTHGGVTPEFLKPFLKGVGIISPLRRLFFKNAYGRVKVNNTNIIITSGITKAGHRNKFHKLDKFFTREITVIDIKKKN